MLGKHCTNVHLSPSLSHTLNKYTVSSCCVIVMHTADFQIPQTSLLKTVRHWMVNVATYSIEIKMPILTFIYVSEVTA